MLNLLLALIPDSALPLIVAGAGLAIVLGLVKPRTAFGFIGSFVLLIIATPFVESLFVALPFWANALIILGGAFWAVRIVLEFALGGHGAGHVIGTAFVGLIKIVFQVLFFPIRVIARSPFARRTVRMR